MTDTDDITPAMPWQTKRAINRRLDGPIVPGAPVRRYCEHRDYSFDRQVAKWVDEGWVYCDGGEFRLAEHAARQIQKKYGVDGEFYG